MQNGKYSSSIELSLDGRKKTNDSSNPEVGDKTSELNNSNQEEINPKNSKEGATDTAPTHNDSTTNIAKSKRNNAGRKKKATAEKKKQMTLTLSPDTYNKLIEWADSKPRSAPNYVSDFVEEHLSEITK